MLEMLNVYLGLQDNKARLSELTEEVQALKAELQQSHDCHRSAKAESEAQDVRLQEVGQQLKQAQQKLKEEQAAKADAIAVSLPPHSAIPG